MSEEKPVSDEDLRVYRSLYSYDKTPLNSAVESVDESDPDWKKERITFDAAYGKERLIAYLFLPKKFAPPYQTIVYFPGADAIDLRSSNDLLYESGSISSSRVAGLSFGLSTRVPMRGEMNSSRIVQTRRVSTEIM